MKDKKIFFLITVLALTGLVINSCKKDNQGSASTLLTRAPWQLASVIVTNYIGTSIISVDTLNTMCDSTQIFTFNTNNTCKYTNFECLPQKSSGTWAVSSNQLTLNSTLSATDTLPGGIINPVKIMPFANTQIYTLGLYSMILKTGDINIFVTPTTKQRIVQYGFVHQATSTL